MVDESLLQLAAADQEKVESWLISFDETWHAAALSDWVSAAIPSQDDPLRPLVLAEMVKIDLERQWQAGARPTLESYLQQYPELGTPKTVSVQLILAEIQVRQQFCQAADLDELAERFPERVDALAPHVRRAGTVAGASADQIGPAIGEMDTSRAGPTTDTAAPAAAARSSISRLPEIFGRYRILKPLGAGGMGAVYLAHDEQLDRQVALKIPHFSEQDGSDVTDRFLREARAAANIHHPNLCPVYDVGEIDGVHYMTMAYIEGHLLSRFIRDGKPVTQRQAALVVRSLALAMQEAHARGIIHRDLKPSNVMIDSRKQPVIMDFGLARRTSRKEAALTQSGVLLGTPAYMAPEQARGNPDEIGPCSDIYSLGVILYELLTGRQPFQGDVIGVLSQVLTAEPEPPSMHRSGLAPDLESICLKAMAKDPADRYESAAELAQALTALLSGTGKEALAVVAVTETSDHVPAKHAKPDARPVVIDGRDHAKGPEKAGAVRRSIPRRVWPVAGGAAALLLLFLGAILLVPTPQGTVRIELSDPQAKVEVSVSGRKIDLKGLGKPLRLEVGEHELIVRGDDYQLYAKSFKIGRGDNPPIRVELLPRDSDGVTIPVDGSPSTSGAGLISDRLEHESKVLFVDFGPDGRMLASSGEDSYVRLWDVATGSELQKVRMPGTASGAIRFHPQGRFLAAGWWTRPRGWNFHLWTLPDLREVPPFGDQDRWMPPFAFSPDGRLLLSRVKSTDGEDMIVEWDLETSTERGRVSAQPGGYNYLSFSDNGKILAAAAGGNRTVHVWGLADRELLRSFAHEAPQGRPFTEAYFALLSPDAKCVIVGSKADLNLFEIATGDRLWGFRRHTWNTYRGALTPDGKAIVTVGGEGDVDHAAVTSLETGKTIRILKKYKGANDVAFHPSGRLMATAGPGRTIKLWDPRNWTEIREPFRLEPSGQ